MVDLAENGSTVLAKRMGDPSALSATPTPVSVYDRVDPMDFVNTFGKVFALTTAGGCQNENQGKLMALAVLCKRQDVFEIAKRYHLMGGKLVVKAEIMLGDFRKAGGKHKWLNDGSDGQSASLQLTDREGNVLVSNFTFEKAKAAGYVKSGSQWEKRPDQMLRARCTTDGIRMLCPEISSGEFIEEEYDDYSSSPATASAPVRTAAEVQKRQAEIQATAGSAAVAKPTQATKPVATTPVATTPVATTQPVEEIVDVQSEPVATVAATTTTTAPVESAPFDADASNSNLDASQQVLMEIELTIKQAGWTIEKVLTAMNGKNNTAYKSLDELPEDTALTLLENLRNIIKQHQENNAIG